MEYNNIFKKNNAGDKCTSKSFHELLEAFKKEGCPYAGLLVLVLTAILKVCSMSL